MNVFISLRRKLRKKLLYTPSESLQRCNTECPAYDTKQAAGETPLMLELYGIQSTPSLSSLPGNADPE